MRKVIAAINMTIDGFCDHTLINPDAEIHNHYRDLLLEADVILYGRTTFQLMQYWQDLLKKPSGEQSMDEFAQAIDRVPKIVFSHTLNDTGWDTAKLADRTPEETIQELKQKNGGDIYIGSRSLIIQALKLALLDELQLCVHPVLAGKGLSLFDDINDRTAFELLNTKRFRSGAVILYYKRCTADLQDLF